jgi:hypothetical protein
MTEQQHSRLEQLKRGLAARLIDQTIWHTADAGMTAQFAGIFEGLAHDIPEPADWWD